MVHATLPRRKQLYEIRQKSDDEFLKGQNQNNQSYDEARAYDDAELLKVIESYCTSAKTRHTVNSLDLTKLSLEEREHALGGGGAGLTATPAPGFSQQYGGGSGGATAATAGGMTYHLPGCQHSAVTGGMAPGFQRQPGVAGGFCCGAFPITKGIVKGLKKM